MPKTLEWTPKTKWARYAIEEEEQKISDLGGEAPAFAEEPLVPEWETPIFTEEAPTPKWEAPPAMPSIERTEAWQPRARIPEVPTAPPPPSKYEEFLKPPEYAPTSWYQTALKAATTPFRLLHEKVEVPGAAAILSGITPEVARKAGESWLEWEKRQYEAWKAPKFVKGITEFAISLPLFLIPYGGISAATSKA